MSHIVVPTLTIRLLGTPIITLNGEQVSGLTSTKAQGLLYYLAVTGQRHPRTTLAQLFWPDSERALGSLRTALSLLSKHLPEYIDVDRKSVTLDRAHIWLDTASFTELLQQIDGTNESFRNVQAVSSLYRGDFLAGFDVDGVPEFEQWLTTTRYQYEQSMVGVLMDLARAYHDQEDHSAALDSLGRLLTLAPGHEAAHRLMMYIFARTGQRGAAIQQFDLCRRYLVEELGVDPAPQTTELYRLILEGDDAVAASEPAEEIPAHSLVAAGAQSSLDLRDMPGRTALVGRRHEISQLEDWLTNSRRSLVMIWGMGGMGKTTLTTEAVHRLLARPGSEGDEFQHYVWRSLRNAPSLDELVDSLIYAVVPEMPTMMPVAIDDKLALLFGALEQRRCLLILDNLETVMAHDAQQNDFRPGYEEYRWLLEQFAHGRHQSCLLMTSRQLPVGLRRLEANYSQVALLQLGGIPAEEGATLLRRHNASGKPETLRSLVEHYSGNPLALNLVASVVNDYYSGNIDAYIRYSASVFDDIRSVLDEQFARSTDLMRDLLVWLAIKREPVMLDELRDALVVPPLQREFLEAVRALTRSSLVQDMESVHVSRSSNRPGFPQLTLHNVVMEYVTDRVLATVQSELDSGRPNSVHRYGLRLAGSSEYIQEMQKRVFLAPLAEWLQQKYGLKEALVRLQQTVERARVDAELARGYLPANVLHLMLQLSSDIHGDFSGLSLRQADLRSATLADVDLRNADLATARFAANFGNVFSVAVSPDGQYLAAGAVQSVVIWEMATLQQVRLLHGQFGNIAEISFTPDSRQLASASYAGMIVVWDVTTGDEILHMKSPAGHLNSLAISHDGQWIAGGGYGGKIAVWQRQQRDWLCMLDAGTRIVGIQFAPTGELIASVGFQYEVQIWDVQEQRLLNVLRGGQINQVGRPAIAVGLSNVAVAHGAEINIWDYQRGELACVLRWKQEWVHGLIFSPDGASLASAHSDGTITIWDVRTRERIGFLAGHHGTVRGLAYTLDGQSLVSGGYDGTVRLWDPVQGVEQQRLYGYLHWTNLLKFSADGAYLAAATLTGDVHLWRSSDRRDARVLKGHTSAVRALVFDPHSRVLATSSDDATIRLWDVKTGDLRHEFTGHAGFVRAVGFDRTGRYLASGGHDSTIRLWSIERGKQERLIGDTSTTIADAIAFHPQMDLLAYGGLDGRIYVSDVESGRTRVWVDLSSQASTLLFSTCGRYLACGAYDGSVTVWTLVVDHDDVQLARRFSLIPSSRCVWRLAFSPASDLLTWGGERTEIFTTRVEDGALLYKIEGSHIEECVAYTLDGAHLISEDGGLAILVRDAATGTVLQRLSGHASHPTSVVVNPVTGVVVSGDVTGTINYWDAASGQLIKSHRLYSPYQGAQITGASGLSEGTRQALLALGAR